MVGVYVGDCADVRVNRCNSWCVSSTDSKDVVVNFFSDLKYRSISRDVLFLIYVYTPQFARRYAKHRKYKELCDVRNSIFPSNLYCLGQGVVETWREECFRRNGMEQICEFVRTGRLPPLVPMTEYGEIDEMCIPVNQKISFGVSVNYIARILLTFRMNRTIFFVHTGLDVKMSLTNRISELLGKLSKYRITGSFPCVEDYVCDWKNTCKKENKIYFISRELVEQMISETKMNPVIVYSSRNRWIHKSIRNYDYIEVESVI